MAVAYCSQSEWFGNASAQECAISAKVEAKKLSMMCLMQIWMMCVKYLIWRSWAFNSTSRSANKLSNSCMKVPLFNVYPSRNVWPCVLFNLSSCRMCSIWMDEPWKQHQHGWEDLELFALAQHHYDFPLISWTQEGLILTPVGHSQKSIVLIVTWLWLEALIGQLPVKIEYFLVIFVGHSQDMGWMRMWGGTGRFYSLLTRSSGSTCSSGSQVIGRSASILFGWNPYLICQPCENSSLNW